jgi:hypothetical protein
MDMLQGEGCDEVGQPRPRRTCRCSAWGSGLERFGLGRRAEGIEDCALVASGPGQHNLKLGSCGTCLAGRIGGPRLA